MKILVAFTEPETTASLSKMLVELGFPEPGAVQSSDDAIAWINSSGGCDLLITEVYFSPADGFTLRDTVLPFLPEMRTLLSSRFDISPYVDRLSGCPFIPQPIKLEALGETLRGLVGGPPVPAAKTQPELPPPAPKPAPAAAPEPTPPKAEEPPKPAETQREKPTVEEKPAKPKATRKKSAKAETVAPASLTGELPLQPAASVAAPPATTAPAPLEEKPAKPAAEPPTPQAPAARPAPAPQPSPQPKPQAPTPAPVEAKSVEPTPPPPAQPVTTAPSVPAPKPQTPAPAVVQAAKSPASRIPTTTIKFEEPAVPKASATPAAPKVAVAKPAVSVSAKPAPVPAPQAAAKPAVAQAAPKLISVGKPPGAAPKSAASTPPASAPVRAQLPPDELVGKTLGNYEILSLSSKFQTERVYRARQTNIERQVLLTVLDPESAKDSAVLEKFLADSRAKARVSHPTVATVYEGGSDQGFHFYSSELVMAPTLAQIQSQGGTVKATVALQAVKIVAEAFAYFAKENIAHLPFSPDAVILKPGTAPRLANIACGDAASTPPDAAEMQALGEAIHKSLPQSAESKTVREVSARLLRAADEPITWLEVAALAQSKMPKAAPADAAKIQARDITINKAVGESRKKSRTRLLIGSAISLGLTAAACYAVYHYLTSSSKVQVGDLGAMIEIPAGEFAYQEERAELPKFYISKYEVSIYEYKKFLDALAADPGLAARVDHPSQPPGKSHVPKGWADETELDPPNPGYFNRARKWGQYQGAPLSLDSPVFGVDWFDAYAYAKWKGQRLPTEKEWEKAARGPKGTQFPWGETADPKLANTGTDFTPNPDPKQGGGTDGFKRYSPVSQPKGDESGYGVFGMAGNVSEWTATLDEDPEMPGEQIPVIRGGNWKNPGEPTATRRVIKLDELMTDETLGFRTVSDTPPAPAQ